MADSIGLNGSLTGRGTLGGKLDTPSSISASLSPGSDDDVESRKKIIGVTLTNNSELGVKLSEQQVLSGRLRMPPWSHESDYELLTNKPSINGHILSGNKTSEDLDIVFENTTAYWSDNPQFVPPKGALIIYSDYAIIDGKSVPGFKVGDGSAYLVDLPFADGDIRDIMTKHINDTSVHITEAERAAWNAKVKCDAFMISGSEYNLIFSTE